MCRRKYLPAQVWVDALLLGLLSPVTLPLFFLAPSTCIVLYSGARKCLGDVIRSCQMLTVLTLGICTTGWNSLMGDGRNSMKIKPLIDRGQSGEAFHGNPLRALIIIHSIHITHQSIDFWEWPSKLGVGDETFGDCLGDGNHRDRLTRLMLLALVCSFQKAELLKGQVTCTRPWSRREADSRVPFGVSDS